MFFEDYNLTSKEVAELLNSEYSYLFDKKLETKDISKWTTNFELNAIKNDKNRWVFRLEDVKDFVYRFENNLLHKFNTSYYDRTRIKVSHEFLEEVFKEDESTFQKIVCVLTTLHPYALFNDPERKYDDLGRHEGGIVFKNAAVHFSLRKVSVKDSVLSFRRQRLLYPVIIARVIESLAQEYAQTDGGNTKARLFTAGWNLTDGRLSFDDYCEEVFSYLYFGGWRGLIHNYEGITASRLVIGKFGGLSEDEAEEIIKNIKR